MPEKLYHASLQIYQVSETYNFFSYGAVSNLQVN